MIYHVSVYTMPGKTLKNHTITINLKFQLSIWNDKFELPNGSYSISDVQDYFEYILNNTEKRLKKLKTESHLKLTQDIILSF